MSTKIYDGYYIAGIETMKEYQIFIREMKESMQPLFQEAFLRHVAQTIENCIDELTLCPEYALRRITNEYGMISEKIEDVLYRRDMIWTDIAGKEANEQVKQTIAGGLKRERLSHIGWEHTKKVIEDGDLACGCEVVFLEAHEKLLAILYTRNEDIRNVWESHPLVKEYGYWNNTDQPDGITDGEWEKRKEDWDIALPGAGIPSREGSTVHMTYSFYQRDLSVILPYFSTKEERAREKAIEVVEERYMEKLEKENPNFGPGKIVTAARKWLKSEEGKRLVDVEIKRIAALLRDITREDIYKRCEDFLKEEN